MVDIGIIYSHNYYINMQSSLNQEKEQEKGLSECILANLEEIDKTYMLKLDLQNNKIVPVENDKLKDARVIKSTKKAWVSII
jgi:hypothetical protein